MADPATIGGTIGGIVGGIIIGVVAAIRTLRSSAADTALSAPVRDMSAILARLAALEASEASRVKAAEDAAEAFARKTFTRTIVALTKELRDAKKGENDARRTDPPSDP